MKSKGGIKSPRSVSNRMDEVALHIRHSKRAFEVNRSLMPGRRSSRHESIHADQDRYGNSHGYSAGDACIGQMTPVPMHFARTINDIYQFHTQLLKRSYLRQLVVKSVRVFHRLSAVPPTRRNRPRRVISRQNASRWSGTAGRNYARTTDA